VEKEYKNKGKLNSEEIDRMEKLLKNKLQNPFVYLNQLTQHFF
jgi:uncharacterized protein YcbK (DUF882 family)